MAALQLVPASGEVEPRSSMLPGVTVRHRGLPLSELVAYVNRFTTPMEDSTRGNYARTGVLAAAGSPGVKGKGAVPPLPEFPSEADCLGWLSSLVTAGYEPTTVTLHRTNLVHIFEVGAMCGVTQGNPMRTVRWQKVAPQRRALSDVLGTWEFVRASDLFTLRERAFIAVLRFCGLRKGEALGLEWRHIDLKRRVLQVDQQRRKASSRKVSRKLKSEAARRPVPIRPELRDLLQELLDAEGVEHVIRTGKGGGKREKTRLVFPYTGDRLGKLMEMLRGLDPEGFPPRDAWHVFRHTCACELWHSGKSEGFIKDWLGHASLEKTAVYLRSIAGRNYDPAEVDKLDPDYEPRPRKKKGQRKAAAKKPRATKTTAQAALQLDAQKDESAATEAAVTTLPSVTGVSAPVVVAVPPAVPMKREPMKTTAVEATPTATTTTPAVAVESSAETIAEVRMLGAQAHEGALRVRASSSSHEVRLNGSTGSPAEVSEANGGEAHSSRRAKKKREAPVRDEHGYLSDEAERLKFVKVSALKLFAHESHVQANALAGVAPQLAEEVLSILGGLVDVLDGRTVADPTVRELMREKAALVRALENMRQAHSVATSAADALAVRCESLRHRVEVLEAERDSVRASLAPMPGESLIERALSLTETRQRLERLVRAYEEKEAAGVKAIDDLCSAQPPASAGFDPAEFDASDYERPAPPPSCSCSRGGLAATCEHHVEKPAPLCNCGAMMTCDCGAVQP